MLTIFYSYGFNNREVALGIWLVIIAVWVISKKTVRKSIGQLLKDLISPKILIPIILMAGYTYGLIFVGFRCSIWDFSNLKDTIVWFFGVAFVLLVNINDSKDDGFFRKSLLDNLRIVLVVEFIINLYAFSFWVEFIFMPIMILIGGMAGVASTKEEYKPVEKLLSYIIGIYGFIVLIISIQQVVGDFATFASVKNLRDFLIPLIMTTLIIPYIYVLALFVQHESVHMRMGFFINDPDLLTYARKRVLFGFNVNLKRLIRWSRELTTIDLHDKRAISSAIQRVKGKSMILRPGEEKPDRDVDLTLAAFIEANHRLISSLGVFTALFVLTNSLELRPFGNLLSALFLALTISIWLELLTKFTSKSGTIRLIFFESILSFAVILLIGYWLIEISSIWGSAVFVILFVTCLSIFSWVLNRFGFFKRFFRNDVSKNRAVRYVVGTLIYLFVVVASYYISHFGKEPLSSFLELIRQEMLYMNL